jgi:hypothetical protein
MVLSIPFHRLTADLVQLPSGNSALTVDITYQDADGTSAAAAPRGAPRPVKAVITTVNDVRCTQITWSNGKTTSRWGLRSRRLTVTDSPTNNSIYVISNADPILLDYGRVPYDLSDFAWIAPGTLASPDPIDYREKSCFHYKGVVSIPISRKLMADEKVEAWIDKTSLLPVALQEGNILYAYTFLPPPPPAPLVMPPDFQAALNRVIAASTPPRVIGTYR